MIKKLSVFLILTMVCLSIEAQTPYINSISPISASIDETVQISGSNLPTSNVEVFFGAVKSTSVIATSTLIQAQVPTGATYGEIYVVNTDTGEIVYSNQRFSPTFDGSNVSASDFNDLNLIGTEDRWATNKLQTQDLCNCDFDNDGDIDVVVTAIDATNLTLFTNMSSPSNVSFETSSISSTRTANAICKDLDGDGLADLIVNQVNASSQGKIFVYRNNTTSTDNVSFEDEVELLLPNDSDGNFRKPGRIAAHDLDLDGHPEVLVATEGENIVYIFNNNSNRVSTPNAIVFDETAIVLSAPKNSGSAGLGGLDVADLNNDGLPEVVASNLTEKGFYIFHNKSSSNSFSFKDPTYHDTNSSIRTLKIGDLNNDLFNDVVLTNSDLSSSNIIEIIKNTTTESGSNISFGSSNQILDIDKSWGLDLGDIDGDQDLDIVVASFGTNSFYCLINNSLDELSSSDFEIAQIINTKNSRNIKLSDIDNDGKLDFVYTNNSTIETSGFLAVRLNHNCITPIIRPSGSVTFCGDGSETIELIASSSNHSYQWKKDNVIVPGESNKTLTLDASSSGAYTVEIIDTNGCSIVSEETSIQNLSETFQEPTITTADTTPCTNDDITITATVDPNTNSYSWQGPNGFTSTDNTSITINDITSINSGDYYLTTYSTTGCQKTSTALTISVNTLPFVTVNNTRPDYFCEGTTLELTTNIYDSYTYDWKKDDTSLDPPVSTTTIDVSEAGSYAVTISNSECSFTSSERIIDSITPPTSTFTTSETTICEGAEISYTANSSGTAGIPIINLWNFDDGSETQEGDFINYAHLTGDSDYEVSLTAQYEDLENCSYVSTIKTISILNAPSGDELDLIISDNSDSNNYEKCKEKTLTLRLEELYESYSWFNITALDSTNISNGPTASVIDESLVAVQLTDNNSCEFYTNSITVSNYTTGGIEITASSSNNIEIDDTLGKTIELEMDQTSVNLTVNNATSPLWTPTDVFDDQTLSSVVATPSNSRELVYVGGFDQFGCQAIDSITIVIPSISGDKTFTPNNDGINDCWEVTNIRSTDCSVIIFDKKGRRIRQFDFNPEENFDDCVWDGTQSNGSEVPSGTYYYIIKCSNTEDQSSGSLLLAR